MIGFLFLMIGPNSIFGWRRRRRRRRSPPPCQAVNCLVGSWSSWSTCSYGCGTSGTQVRTRQVTRSQSCGGTCHYHFSESQACNRGNCRHGGTPHSSGCSCRTGYGGQCCDRGELRSQKKKSNTFYSRSIRVQVEISKKDNIF